MIRKATVRDFFKLYSMINEINIPYITTEKVFKDIDNKECYIIEENGNIKAICSLVFCPSYHNYAIKRLCVFDEQHGYGTQIIQFLTNKHVNFPIVCTPWEDNTIMRKILEQNHFKLKYIFNYKWCLYEL